MSEFEFKNLTPEDLDRMTDDEVARIASDPTANQNVRVYMKGLLMGRMDRHLDAFFPGLL